MEDEHLKICAALAMLFAAVGFWWLDELAKAPEFWRSRTGNGRCRGTGGDGYDRP